jgi:hypothetical protein
LSQACHVLVTFVLSYLSLAEQLLLLYTPGTRHLINESLVSVLHAQLRHLELAVKADKVGHSLKGHPHGKGLPITGIYRELCEIIFRYFTSIFFLPYTGTGIEKC